MLLIWLQNALPLQQSEWHVCLIKQHQSVGMRVAYLKAVFQATLLCFPLCCITRSLHNSPGGPSHTLHNCRQLDPPHIPCARARFESSGSCPVRLKIGMPGSCRFELSTGVLVQAEAFVTSCTCGLETSSHILQKPRCDIPTPDMQGGWLFIIFWCFSCRSTTEVANTNKIW